MPPSVQGPLSLVDENQKVVGALSVVGAAARRKIVGESFVKIRVRIDSSLQLLVALYNSYS